MPLTEFGTNDPQTVKVWANDLFKSALESTFISRFMGTGDDNIIKRQTDLEKGSGDDVRVSFLDMLTGAGVDGDDELKDREEEMTFFRQAVGINQKRHATGFRRMTQQRTLHGLRSAARDVLGKWYARKYDQYMFSYLAGFPHTNVSSELSTTAASSFAGNALLEPDDDHAINHSGSTIYTDLTTDGTATFIVDHLEEAVVRAKTADPIMEPATFDGREMFVAVLHPYSIHNLRVNSTTTQWREVMSRAGVRGSDNAIFRDAVGEWNGVLVLESNNVPIDTANNDVYNMLLGKSAGMLAFGNAYSKLDQGFDTSSTKGGLFSWFENTDDFGNRKAVAAGSIFGIQKRHFNSVTHGVVTMVTNDSAP